MGEIRVRGLFFILLICGAEAIRVIEKRKSVRERSEHGEEEKIMVYEYLDKDGNTIYQNEEQHEASCNEMIETLCDHKHHGVLAAKLTGLFQRYYDQVKINNEHVITSSLTEWWSGTSVDDLLPVLADAKETLHDFGNKCGGLDHFVQEGETAKRQRCGMCGDGCKGLDITQEWFDKAQKKTIRAVQEMSSYIEGFENSADAWIRTLESTRDHSFTFVKGCAIAIAVPYAAGAFTTAGGKLIVGTAVGGLTGGTMTAGTEGLIQGLNIHHGLQREFDWDEYKAAIKQSMIEGAVGGASGVIMNLGSAALAEVIEKIGGYVTQKLMAAGADVTRKVVVEYLHHTYKAAVRQFLISAYKLSSDDEYSGRDFFADIAYALMVGGVAKHFGVAEKLKISDSIKFNDIAVTDNIMRKVIQRKR